MHRNFGWVARNPFEGIKAHKNETISNFPDTVHLKTFVKIVFSSTL